jgi:hypothetical protein
MARQYKKRDFKDHVLKNILVDPVKGCWLWQRATQKIDERGRGGYAMLTYNDKWQTGHRAVYQEWVGPIPTTRFVLHTCDVRHCMNPDHLWLGTQQQNMDDMVRKGRQSTGGRLRSVKVVTNGYRTKRIPINDPIPEGFREGKRDQSGFPGARWYTNGVDNCLLFPGEDVREGFYPGATQKHEKPRGTPSGFTWYTNGVRNKQVKPNDAIPDGFTPGMRFVPKVKHAA